MRLVKWLSTEASEAELIRLGSNSIELLGVAVQIAGEKHPECFGRSKSSTDHDVKVEELKLKQTELFKQIAENCTGADLQSDEKNRDLPVTFKVSGGQVPLSPQDDAGERLVKFLMQQREQRQGI